MSVTQATFGLVAVNCRCRRFAEPAAIAAAVRGAIADIDPNVPIDSVRTMSSAVGDSVASRRFQAVLLLLFSAIAVTLAGVGVFGVMSCTVAQRSKELGVRLALGASPRSLQRMVLRNSLRLLGTGVVFGMPLASIAGYVFRSLLFDVQPDSPGALAAAAGLVIAVGLAAAWLPAHRTTRINPVATLRVE